MAKWRPGFDAERAVARVADTALVSADDSFGGFGYLGFEYALVLLEGNVLLDDALLPDERLSLVRRACTTAARRGELTARRVAGEISREQNALLSRPVETYRVISDISVAPSVTLPRLSHRGSAYTLHPRLSRTARTAREELVDGFRHQVLGEWPTDYSTISVSVRAREGRALDDGLHRLELLRGLWNLQAHRHSRRLSHGRSPTINVLGFGPVHTLHRPDGTLAAQHVLIDSRYRAPVTRLEDSGRFGHMDTYARRVLDILRRFPYADDLERAIVRYGYALDSREFGPSLVELWSVLERLTGTDTADYDRMVRRATFQFEHGDEVRQVLEHVRRRRNASVHEGDEGAGTEILVYQLKDVVERTLALHLTEGHRFGSIAEFARVLDAPPDEGGRARRASELERELEHLRVAGTIRSRGSPDRR